MIDGVYQSVMCFFIPYLTLTGAAFVSFNGLDVTDRLRLGCYIAHPAVITINLYILINTYRWDWLILLLVVLSDLFIFFWTGVYTSTPYSGVFFQAAPQVYAEASFWAVLLITPVICIFPRYAIKAIQKVYFPYDIDIIREQVRQGKFASIDPHDSNHHHQPSVTDAAEKGVVAGGAGAGAGGVVVAEEASESTTSSGGYSSSRKGKHPQYNASVDEDRRPIYPPSVATHNTRTQNGSDGTNYTLHNRLSADTASMPSAAAAAAATATETANNTASNTPDANRHRARPSIDRARPSYDRIRASMDRVRASYEASSDFTTAARLSRLESSHSANHNVGRAGSGGPPPTGGSRGLAGRLRGLSIISNKSKHNNG